MCALLAAAQTVPAAALMVATSSIVLSSVTIDGTDQTVAGTTSAWRVDAVGETGGWKLTVSSSDFVSGGSDTIPVEGFTIRLPDAAIVWVSGDVLGPSSTQTTFAQLSATPLKIATAAVGEANGVYDLTPEFQLEVPAETHTGTYIASVTIDVAAGP